MHLQYSRRERGTCRICWSAANAIDVMLSGNAAIASGQVGTSCCGYNTNGQGTGGYDCVVIPSATKTATTQVAVVGGSAFCGRSQGLVTSAGARTTPRTVCCKKDFILY